MKEKKNTTTFLGCVVLTDRVTLYVRLLDYYYNTTHKKINSISGYEISCLDRLEACYGEERIKEAFERAERSDFLSGRKGCDWCADFRWIITPRNFKNILAGKYDDFSYNKKPFVRQPSAASGYSAAVPSTLSSFEGDEFIEAALARGFDD